MQNSNNNESHMPEIFNPENREQPHHKFFISLSISKKNWEKAEWLGVKDIFVKLLFPLYLPRNKSFLFLFCLFSYSFTQLFLSSNLTSWMRIHENKWVNKIPAYVTSSSRLVSSTKRKMKTFKKKIINKPENSFLKTPHAHDSFNALKLFFLCKIFLHFFIFNVSISRSQTYAIIFVPNFHYYSFFMIHHRHSSWLSFLFFSSAITFFWILTLFFFRYSTFYGSSWSVLGNRRFCYPTRRVFTLFLRLVMDFCSIFFCRKS